MSRVREKDDVERMPFPKAGNDNRLFITAGERKGDLYARQSNIVLNVMGTVAVCICAIALAVFIIAVETGP